jgi:hypothetical protein
VKSTLLSAVLSILAVATAFASDATLKDMIEHTRDVLAVKQRLGVPEKLAACHTAVIDGYVVEGHITHRDIKRLLLFRPDITGIAVPGMPIGTPGMESGDTMQSYDVINFDDQGNTQVFVAH